MKTHYYFLLAFISLGSLHAQEWQTPIIEGYGEVKYFSEAAVQPDTSLSYNLLFDIKSEATKSGVNKELWVMARMLNLLSVAGVPTEKIHLVASIHGSATFITLNEEAYQKKYGKPNPNANLIRQLKEHGVGPFLFVRKLPPQERSLPKRWMLILRQPCQVSVFYPITN